MWDELQDKSNLVPSFMSHLSHCHLSSIGGGGTAGRGSRGKEQGTRYNAIQEDVLKKPTTWFAKN